MKFGREIIEDTTTGNFFSKINPQNVEIEEEKLYSRTKLRGTASLDINIDKKIYDVIKLR